MLKGMPTQILAMIVPSERRTGIDQPVLALVDQADGLQGVVDDAEIAVEHPAEDAAADDRRQQPAQEEHRPEEAAPGNGRLKRRARRKPIANWNTREPAVKATDRRTAFQNAGSSNSVR